jgi:GTP-binding protein Era
MSKKKVGFVGIVGRPNVGKSTLLNYLIGEKVAITSDKPQTTRNQILGIRNTDTSQIIFVDTPGIHKPRHALGEYLDEQAIGAIKGVDLILYMVDDVYKPAEYHVIKHFQNNEAKVLLVINKIDLLKSRSSVDDIIVSYLGQYDFYGVYPISSLEGTHIEHLLEDVEELLEENEVFYPEEQTTTQSDFTRMSELIREKVLYHTQEEVPHSVAVIVDYAEMKDGVYNLYASIIVERPSQKNILIGKGGQMIKKIGTDARKDINKTLGTKVHLELWVKVIKNWRQKQTNLQGLGYE